MDRDLLKQSVAFHGQTLFSLLKCEQSENPDFKHVTADLAKSVNQRDKEDDSPVVEQFIARKADLLFAPAWKSTTPGEEEWQEESQEPYAIMPPLEQFMDVSYNERRELFYRDVERGDVVIGRITSIRDFGFFVNLLCTAGGMERDVEDLEIMGLCPIRDVPSTGNHDDPLSYFHIGDLIRAGVKDIDRYHEKLTVSLYPTSLALNMERTKLGVISKEELPLHYTRGEQVTTDSRESYEMLLQSSLGFSNPSSVDYLLGMLGIGDTQSHSLMRGLQSKHFMEDDFASAIRKKQSASWALKCVKAGVNHFKSGRHVEAMNEYNKALEMDTNNVEALVARGALYATKGSLVKAISDFELALESCPTHRNAKKYLCQTLVERGGQLEEEEKLITAEGLYKKAIALDDTFHEAKEALRKLQMHIQKTLKLKAEEAAKEKEKQLTAETSAEKLRKILKEEKRMKKKRKRYDSTSETSSSSDSSSDDLSSRKKPKKRKHKRRRSSHSGKKHKQRVSSRDEEEHYPVPANTSASFINEKQTLIKLLDGENRAENRTLSHEKSREGRFEDDPFTRSPETEDRKVKGQNECFSGLNGRDKDTYRDRRRSEDEHSTQQESCRNARITSCRKDSSSSAYSETSRKSDSRDFDSRKSSSRTSDSRNSHSSDSRRSDSYKSGSHGRSEVREGNDRQISYSDVSKAWEGNQKKNVPTNLLDIFNQIAEFERERKKK
ncbi:tetratricopeptide repeat protein 14 isoform X2 [Ictalurus punctatus]|uniref:Tetratricopeptide repeat protein 14 isoform X2 n=1 Tax=Ictalurus punctatus TaxID=7998 RepID=A0A2D0RTS7_ICTPU|nr:tetratricopeptide repeat protein 14 isoform X2 [Ictalurus punctatus]